MKHYLRFVAIGLVLGLFTEIVFRLIATVNPKAFLAAVFLYPVILTLAYAAHKLIGRVISPQWRGDVLHYLACGLCGLGVEWILLGNGPDSNAFQLGMFGMWTTFCFGPRVLTRESPSSAGGPPEILAGLRPGSGPQHRDRAPDKKSRCKVCDCSPGIERDEHRVVRLVAGDRLASALAFIMAEPGCYAQ